MNILVTGANGQLGSCFKDVVPKDTDNVYFYSDRYTDYPLDITDYEAVSNYIKSNEIDVILNFAAYTNVAKAEEDTYGSFKVNTYGCAALALAIKQRNGLLIHISTDYVYSPFDGWDGSPFKEDDVNKMGRPMNVYGVTKLNGERAIQCSGCRYLIVRTSWLYSSYGKNFLTNIYDKLMTGDPSTPIRVVNDQIGTPTNANTLANFLHNIIKNNSIVNISECVLNFSNYGVCSWYDFAKEIRNVICNSTNVPDVIPCNSETFPSKVKRPYFSVMSKDKLIELFPNDIPNEMDWAINVHNETLRYYALKSLK